MAVEYSGILVTGGAGFVGSHVAVWAKRRFPDARVLAADNLRRRGSETNLGWLRANGVLFVHADIRSSQDLALDGELPHENAETASGRVLVVECSAEPSVLAGYDGSPDYVVQTNLVGTYHCLELCRRIGADLVFLSTSRVYPMRHLNALRLTEGETRFHLDDEQAVPGVSARGISEAFPLDGARSLYGATKLSSELLIQEYASMYGLRAIINRCGVLTGPRQMGKVDQGVFTLWVAHHYFGLPLSYIGFGGSGKQVRDLLHVDDLTDLLAIELDQLDRLAGETFNVGGGLASSLSLQEATRLCEEVTGRSTAIRAVPVTRDADMPLYVTDTQQVHLATGWQPHRTPRDTLTDIYEWIRADEERLRSLWVS
jgi:CDP-paratose 2-epimerase